MKLLLDTHILLWWLADDPRLPLSAATAIGDGETFVAVSAASAWEIAIKKAAGRLQAPDEILEAIEANHFDALSVSAAHALAAGALPAHHAHPFDRMLIAQARAEGLTVVTVDGRFSPTTSSCLRSTDVAGLGGNRLVQAASGPETRRRRRRRSRSRTRHLRRRKSHASPFDRDLFSGSGMTKPRSMGDVPALVRVHGSGDGPHGRLVLTDARLHQPGGG